MSKGNKNVVLVMGKPSTGKTTSLMKLPNLDRLAYLNCDLKELPFKGKFKVNVDVATPYSILDYIDEIETQPNVDGAVIDTITLLMKMFVAHHIDGQKDTRAAWGRYGSFYTDMVHRMKSGTKDYAVLAHVDTKYNEKTEEYEDVVPIQGAVGKVGAEADFTTILVTKKIPIFKLEGRENDLLRITEEEKEDGYKFVFQTRPFGGGVVEKMRAARGLWDRKELYIDNDLGQVFDRLKKYYA